MPRLRPRSREGIVLASLIFDKIVAVNVNAFWLPPATDWLGLAHAPAVGIIISAT